MSLSNYMTLQNFIHNRNSLIKAHTIYRKFGIFLFMGEMVNEIIVWIDYSSFCLQRNGVIVTVHGLCLGDKLQKVTCNKIIICKEHPDYHEVATSS